MSQPIVMIFNRHWESTPFQLIKNLIPNLEQEGYETYCQELPDTLSRESVLQWSQQRIEKQSIVLNLFNTSADKSKLSYPEKLERCTFEELQESFPSLLPQPLMGLKGISASKLYHSSLELALKYSFSITCIDDAVNLKKLESTPMSSPEYMLSLEKTSRARRDVMGNHLFNLQAEGKGILVHLGWKHFKPMIAILNSLGLTDENIVCHFAHSSYPISRIHDEIKDLHQSGQIFSDKTTCATTSQEIDLLGQKILAEVKYKRYISRNCHTQFLTEFFKVNFKAVVRAEYYVDALLSSKQINAKILSDLDDLSIQNHKTRLNNQDYLIIPNVNTTEVGERIRLLPYLV